MKRRSFLSVLIFISAIMAGQVNLTNGLTACYGLNGNGYEPVSSLTGTLNNVSATLDRFGNANSACLFDGSDTSYIVLPDNPLLKPTNAVSFSGWVNASYLPPATGFIVFTRNAPNSNYIESYSLFTTNAPGYFCFGVEKSYSNVYSTTAININTWYHVAFVIDTMSLKIYVNGVLENTQPSNFQFNYQPGKNIYLGGSNENPYYLPFTGAIDNVRFYNRILTNAEVNALYLLDPICRGDIATDIKNNKTEDIFSVFPNPTDEKATIGFSETSSGEITILNNLSQVIYETKFENKEYVDVNLDEQAKGIYYVQIKTSGKTITKKIIKQ